MSSFEQKFDPSNPKYKTTADLPIVHQDNFADTSGLVDHQSGDPGFIREQAARYFHDKHFNRVESVEEEARREDFLAAVAKLLEGRKNVYAGELVKQESYPYTERFIGDISVVSEREKLVAPIGERDLAEINGNYFFGFQWRDHNQPGFLRDPQESPVFRIGPARDSEDDESGDKYFIFGKEVPGDLFSDYLDSLRIQGITVIEGESFLVRQKFEDMDRLLEEVSSGMDRSILEKYEEVKQFRMNRCDFSRINDERRRLLQDNLTQAKYETENVKE